MSPGQPGRPSVRDNPFARAVIVVGGVVVVALAVVTGFGLHTDPSAIRKGSPMTTPTPGQGPVVLEEQAVLLRARIASMVAGLRYRATQPASEEAVYCRLDRDWPKRWKYTLNYSMPGGDSRPQVRDLMEILRRDGWRVEERPSRSYELSYTVRKQGSIVMIKGGSPPASSNLLVQSFSACVEDDGVISTEAIYS